MALAWFASFRDVFPRQHKTSQKSSPDFVSPSISSLRKFSSKVPVKCPGSPFFLSISISCLNIGSRCFASSSHLLKVKYRWRHKYFKDMIIFDPLYLSSSEHCEWSPLQCSIIASTMSHQSLGVLPSFSANELTVIWIKMFKSSFRLFPKPRTFPFTPLVLTKTSFILDG